MKRFALLACLLAMPLSADEPIVGTWRVDPLRATINRNERAIELKDGVFRCPKCVPPFEIKADGAKHPASGAEGEWASARIVDEHTVEHGYFIGERLVASGTDRISTDGRRRVREEIAISPDGTKVTVKYSYERTGPGAPGAHALSGTWGNKKTIEMSDAGRESTYRAIPGGLAASDPTGFSYEARFDGKRYPVKGADRYEEVRIRRIDARVYEEKYWDKGKNVLTNRLSVSPDGKTLTSRWSVPGESGTDVAERK